MAIVSATLRPGLLVSLKTSVRGNVTYSKKIIEDEHITENGIQQARWETERTVTDPAENERAKKARSRAASVIRSVCTISAFGLLCPEASADALDAAIKEARAIVDEFNASAALSRLSVYVITGRIAPDDVEAVKAINSEIRELLSDMEQGIANCDVAAIRQAATRAKEVGGMLSPDSEARVRIAIDTARESAKRIVKAGEAAAIEVDTAAMRKITEMRTAFLDLDEVASTSNLLPVEARAVDLTPVTEIKTAAASRPAMLDL